ncbi:MAG: methyltransferase [Chitinophagaceae bacterium]|nr:methyltransferase [Chitinophagaceae bacterium]
MKTAIRHIVEHTYKPLLVRYLTKTRVYRHEDIRLEIPPEVFHPGFFFSTRLLLNYIRKLPLKGKKLLELGCGSALIGMCAARQGAKVTATDINPIAITFVEKNSLQNDIKLTPIHSNLFEKIPAQSFDIIAINPPYYKKNPGTNREYAWYCGENGEYFQALFAGLRKYVHSQSEVLMVLFEGCDLEMIENLAAMHGFNTRCVQTNKNFLETSFIFQIEPVN